MGCEDCNKFHESNMIYCPYHNKCYFYEHKICNKCDICIALNNGHEFDTNERICNLCDVTKKIELVEIIDNSKLLYCELENKYDTYKHKYCEIDGTCMSEFDIHCMECNRCHHFTQEHYCLGCNYCFDHIHKLCEHCNKCLSISGIKNTKISKCTNCNHDFPTIFKNHDYICSDCNCKKINNGLNYFI